MTKIIPRISTRGYYDLKYGKTIKKNSYFLYPKKDFKKFIGSKELVIMIHGLRNDNAGAIAKVILANRGVASPSRCPGFTTISEIDSQLF